MPTRYHRFAGSSLDRLAALSDGVFAVAMTLLVLDLKAPPVPRRAQHPIWSGGGGGSEHALLHDLAHQVAPRLLPYAMSFLTLGIFWVGQQTQLSSSTRSTRGLTWIHLTFLLAVTLMPFSTGLLAQDTAYRLSMAVYWLNLFALGVVLFIGLEYADQAGLMSDDTTQDMRGTGRLGSPSSIAVARLSAGTARARPDQLRPSRSKNVRRALTRASRNCGTRMHLADHVIRAAPLPVSMAAAAVCPSWSPQHATGVGHTRARSRARLACPHENECGSRPARGDNLLVAISAPHRADRGPSR